MSELMSHHPHHPHHLDPEMEVGHADTTEVLLSLLSQNKMLEGSNPGYEILFPTWQLTSGEIFKRP